MCKAKSRYCFFCRTFIILLIFVSMGWGASQQQKDQKKIKKYFKMDLYELMGVEVTTAGKQKEKISEIPASVILVTREDIETAGYQSLTEILESIPGLYISDNYFMKNVGVRGFMSYYYNRNMIFLVNGIPQRDEYFSNYILETFPVPVEAIDRVEVVRGPMSVVYGAGGFFGVVNIITNQPDKKAPSNMAAVSVGSEKTMKVFARSTGKTGDFKYTLNASVFSTDGIDIDLGKTGGSGLAGIRTANHLESRQKVFDFTGEFKNLSLNVFYSESHQGNIYILPPVNEDGASINFKNLRLNIGYKKSFSKTLRLESKIGYFQTSWDWDVDFLFDNLYSDEQVLASSINAELSLFYDPTPRLGVTLGVYYINVPDISLKVDIPLFGLDRVYNRLADGDSIVQQSLFVQVKYQLMKKLQMVAGMMVEQSPKYTLESVVVENAFSPFKLEELTFDQTEAVFIPRLALIYSPNKKNVFKFLYGKAFDRPSFFMNLDILNNPGTPFLEPETIQTFEVNYTGHLSPRLTLNASVFWSKLDNLIYLTAGFNPDNTISYYSTNRGELTTVGVEFTIQSEPFKNLRLELSGTYLDTKDKRANFEDIRVNDSPRFLGYFKGSYFFNKHISLAMTGQYVGDMVAYFDDTLPEPARVGEPVDEYFLWGANLRVRKLFGTGMFLNLKVSNLFDEEIHYPAIPTNTRFANNGTVGRGRSFLLTLGWKF